MQCASAAALLQLQGGGQGLRTQISIEAVLGLRVPLKDTFIGKDFRLTAESMAPRCQPDTQQLGDHAFHEGPGQQREGSKRGVVDLSIIAEASRKASISVLQPGDHIEVFEGEQSGVHGTVHNIKQDVVTIERAEGVDFDGQRMQIPARAYSVREQADMTDLLISMLLPSYLCPTCCCKK